MEMEGGVGSGGPAPFLLKTYEMVDDSSTDAVVSWSPTNNSFIVWNPAEFGRLLLPSYFKHNNFSSFIRQLNTYGFRKIHAERWEFANEDFVRDQKHLLKNIHRRKPIHSHSNPPGSLVDPERAAFEDEIDKLSREKATIESNVSTFKQHQSAAKLHLDDLRQRLDCMEKRQQHLLDFFQTALHNPTLVEQISRKIESMDLSAYNKKRRLPHNTSRMEFGNVFHQDFSDKLRLELSPTISDVNLGSQSSSEDRESPHNMHPTTTTALTYAPDLSDTGASCTFNMDLCLSQRPESTKIHTTSDQGDSHIPCHLSLTLASSPLQANVNSYSARSPQIDCQEIGKLAESGFYSSNGEESDKGVSSNKNPPDQVTNLASSQEAPSNKQETPAASVRVNDVFWEQFLQ